MTVLTIPGFTVTVDTVLPEHGTLGEIVNVGYTYDPHNPKACGPVVTVRLAAELRRNGVHTVVVEPHPHQGYTIRSQTNGRNVRLPFAEHELCSDIWNMIERVYRLAVLRAFAPVVAPVLSVEFTDDVEGDAWPPGGTPNV